MRKAVSLGCVTLVALLALAAPAAADPLSIVIGLFGFDTSFPETDPTGPGVNAFTINNFTGSAAFDPNASTELTFDGLLLTLTEDTSTETLALGSLGPGALIFQVDPTRRFQSALLHFTLSTGTFFLPDGDLFTAASVLFDVVLSPSLGNDLTAGVDVAGISLDGETSASTPVPEPSSIALLAGGLSSIIFCSRRRRHLPNRE